MTIWVTKKIFAKGLEFLHVVFNIIEKRGPVFFPLVFALFIKTPLGKASGFCAYAISQKRSEAYRKNYGTLLSIPKQNCMQNLERFRQSSLLIKIPNALFPPRPLNKRSWAFVMINRADPLL